MPSRRRFLAATAALAATSGCAAVSRLNPLDTHELYERAPVTEATGPWPTLAADPARTGAVTDERAPTDDANVVERARVGRFAEHQPAVAGGRGYLGVDRREFTGRDGEYAAGDFTGLLSLDLTATRSGDTVLWRSPAGGPSTAFTPSVRGQVVYAPLGAGVKALDAVTGEVYWRTNAGGLTPTAVGRDCYTVGGDDGLVALDAATGETRWTSEGTDHAPSGFAVVDDAVFLACGDAGDGSLWAFERSDGSTRWRYPDLDESYATAVADDERVYAVSTGGRLHAVGHEGERRWTHRLDGDSYIQPAVADGTVYFTGTNNDTLYALDAATGDVAWERPTGIGGSLPPTVTAESVILVSGTQDGERLFVLDRADGTERTRFEFPDGMDGTAQPVVADGVCYLVGEPRTASHWSLYALR